jgi:nucleoside-diphosphate-sugar epimerase
MVNALVLGVHHLLDAAAAAGCRRFIQLGSATEYGACDVPLEERMAPGPSSPFGAAKATASMLCLRAGRRRTMATVVLRPFAVYGPGDHPARLIPTALRAALEGAALPLTPTGYRRDWVFVSDVAEGCVRALAGGADGEVVNLGSGVQHTNEEVIGTIEHVTGCPVQVRAGAVVPRPWDRRSWVASTDKARALLGWEARTSLAEGIRRTAGSWGIGDEPRAAAASA